MLHTPLTDKASQIAYKAHEGQPDLSGMPYVLHPIHVAQDVQGEINVCVALLHDVLEDSDYTADDLRAEGMPGEVIAAVEILTRDPSVPYEDYIRSIKASGNQVAITVKLADLRHNADLSRLRTITDEDIARREKYIAAAAVLREES